MEKNNISVKTVVIKNEMKYNGITLLKYRIEYPQFKSNMYQTSIGMVNLYYMEKAANYQQHCETELFDMAVEQYKDDIKNNFPVRMFEAMLVYKITYLQACIISLYNDRYEYTGGAHGNTVRDSQTWNLQKGTLLKLKQLFICPVDYKAYIIKEVQEQIEKDPSFYFEDYKKLIIQTFNPNSFYCTANGLVVYYQQYDIAPYSSGIREFLLPYNQCLTDPKGLCPVIPFKA